MAKRVTDLRNFVLCGVSHREHVGVDAPKMLDETRLEIFHSCPPQIIKVRGKISVHADEFQQLERLKRARSHGFRDAEP